MRCTRVIMILLLANIFSLSAAAEDEDSTIAAMQREYDIFVDIQQKEYKKFRDSAFAEYTEFVRKAWQEFEGKPAMELPKEEKALPVFSDEANVETASWWSVLKKSLSRKKKKDSKQSDIKPVIGNGEALAQGTVMKPETIIPQPAPQYTVDESKQQLNPYMTFKLFGTEYKIRVGDNCKFKLAGISENQVADAMKQFSEPRFDNMLYDCIKEREKHHLSDWAYYLMLQAFVDSFYGKNTNEASLVLAFLYSQTGYKMRMIRDASNINLYSVAACHHWIYGKDYTYVDGDRYYLLDGRKLPRTIYVCQAKFSKESSMSLQMSAEQQFSPNPVPQRTITSKVNDNLSFTITSNKNYMDFYDTYPRSTIGNNYMTQWLMYADTPLESGVRGQLYPAMSQKLQGLSQLDAVQQILWWVQTGLEYKFDDEVWGVADRIFFGEESLFYPYCDCEDRAILFSHLVREIVGLDVLLVYYPGHLATAVHFTEDVKGDYYTYDDGRKFIVCDPTIIYGRVGQTMKSVANEKASIMLLKRI